MDANLRTELTDLLREMQKSRAQVQPRVLLSRMQLLSARLEDETMEVPAEVFELLDNDGRRICLTALLAICAAALMDK